MGYPSHHPQRRRLALPATPLETQTAGTLHAAHCWQQPLQEIEDGCEARSAVHRPASQLSTHPQGLINRVSTHESDPTRSGRRAPQIWVVMRSVMALLAPLVMMMILQRHGHPLKIAEVTPVSLYWRYAAVNVSPQPRSRDPQARNWQKNEVVLHSLMALEWVLVRSAETPKTKAEIRAVSARARPAGQPERRMVMALVRNELMHVSPRRTATHPDLIDHHKQLDPALEHCSKRWKTLDLAPVEAVQ